MIEIIPTLLTAYDIVHQTGGANIDRIKEITNIVLQSHPFKDRYYAEGFLDVSLFYPKVDMVITRAGSSMFEMVLWQLPMIVIPIPETISRDQRSNAYAMAAHGFAIVLEENNMGANILTSAISRILESEETYKGMTKNAALFDDARSAASVIARELIRISLSHS